MHHTDALSQKKAKRDHFPFLIIQAIPCIVIAEAVVCQPAVDIPAKHRAIGLSFRHTLSKQLHLFRKPLFKSGFFTCCSLGCQRQFHTMQLQNLIRRKEKIILHPGKAPLKCQFLLFFLGKPRLQSTYLCQIPQKASSSY